jgi:protein phosphatase
MLTRALTGEPVDADLFTAGLRGGDVVLICSDGVWDAVDDTRIADAMQPGVPLDAAAAALCDRALAAGSTDNVTVVACRVHAAGD